jgi:hypothetical protein
MKETSQRVSQPNANTFNPPSSSRKSKTSSYQQSSEQYSEVAQDIEAADEIDDFEAVEVPSAKGGDIYGEEQKIENSVQVVDDNYYIDDFDEPRSQQMSSARQSKKSKINRLSASRSQSEDDYEF